MTLEELSRVPQAMVFQSSLSCFFIDTQMNKEPCCPVDADFDQP